MKSLLALAGLSFICMTAQASPITVTISMTATGEAGETPFTNAVLTLTFVGDTSSRATPLPADFNIPFASGQSIFIGGVGTGTINPATYVFDYQTYNLAGFGDSHDLTHMIDPAYGTYDLLTSIGPINDASASVANWGTSTLDTTLGLVTVTSESNVSFTATVTPEPASALSLLSGLGLITFVGRKFRKQSVR